MKKGQLYTIKTICLRLYKKIKTTPPHLQRDATSRDKSGHPPEGGTN